jgi:hypothetical protein
MNTAYVTPLFYYSVLYFFEDDQRKYKIIVQ